MSNRHHIYNFHIGFWNAFLISLVVIIQSALFLMVSSGISLAAVNDPDYPINITAPALNTDVDEGSTIDLVANTPNNARTLRFVIYQIDQATGSRNPVYLPPKDKITATDNVNWADTWDSLNTGPGNYEVEAIAEDANFVEKISTRVAFTVGQQVLTVDLIKPTTSITLVDNSIFTARTANLPPDSVHFILTPIPPLNTGPLDVIPATPATPGDQVNWTSAPYSDWSDSTIFPPGDYFLFAVATGGGDTITSTQNIIVTIPADTTITQEILITKPPAGSTWPGANATTSVVAFEATTNYELPAGNKIVFLMAGQDATGANVKYSFPADSQGGFDPVAGIQTWQVNYDIGPPVQNLSYNLTATETLPDTTITNVPIAMSSIIINNPTATAPDLVITTQSPLSDATLGQDYLDANGNAVTLDATGGGDGVAAPTYEWTIPDLTTFVPGLSLNFATGVISGTPTTAKSYTFNIQVSDKINTPVKKSFSITVIDPNADVVLPPPADPTLPSFANPVSMPGLVSPLPDVKEGDPYNQTLKCQGGSVAVTTYPPMVGAPGWLKLDSTTGALTGTPLAGTIPGTADSVILSFTVQCQNGNDTVTQQTSVKVTKVATPPPPPPAADVPATLELSAPNSQTVTGLVFKGNNVVINMVANESVGVPTVMLVQGGRNVIDQTAPPPSSTDATGQNWTYVLDSNKYPNGDYEFRAQARATDDNTLVVATSLNVTIDNAVLDPDADVGPVYEGGTITNPGEGKGLSGKILLSANVLGGITNVTFKVETAKDGTKVVPAIQDPTDVKKWSVVWNSAGIQAGPIVLRAEVVDDAGNVHVLPKVNFNLVVETIALEPELLTTTEITAEPTIEEVVAPEILPNITDDGLIATTPVECQIVGITDEAECDEYLRTREIRLLNEQEQEKVEDDLTDIVAHHIELGDGVAVSVDPTAPVQEDQKIVEDPLAEILPIDKDAAKGVTVLVLTSTEVPDNLKPFVEQTVPAVLIFDQDGDGLSDETEVRLGTDPNNPDSDGDGFTDGEEIKNGYNPLGAGRFRQVLAPIEQAILNNRPLDQPKFAGRIDEENLKVNRVQTTVDPTKEDGKVLRLSGKAEPNSFVTLYIYSSLPIVISVQADASGNWEYDLTHPLVDGKHDVYATVTNDTGKIIKKSRALSFFVQSASAVTEEEFLQATIDIPDASGVFMLYYMLGGILIVFLGGGMFFYYIKQQKSFS